MTEQRRWSRTGQILPALAALAAASALVLPQTQTPAQAQTQRVGECTNAELSASYRSTDAGMSHRYGRLVLRNTSDHACRTRGYGGLSYVGRGDGTQIGAAADRAPGKVRSIVVRSGQRVFSPVVATLAEAYPRRECRPVAVDGFRVYLPDETRSQFVRHRTTGCRDVDVHLLSHRPYRRP